MATEEEVALEQQKLKHLEEGLELIAAHRRGETEVLRLTREQIAAINDLTASERRSVEQLQSRLTTTRELLEYSKQEATSARDHYDILNLNKRLREEELQVAQHALDSQRAKVAAAKQAASAASTAGRAAREDAAAALRAETAKLAAAQKAIRALNDQQRAQSSIYSSANSILKTTLGISDAWKDTSFGSVAMAGQGAFDTLKGTLQSTLSPMNILGSTLMKIQESTLALIQSADKLGSSFAKQTGLMGTNTAALQRNYYAMNNIRASMDEVNNSAAALATQSSKFIDLSQAEADALVRLSTTMDKAGYGTQFVASQLDTFTIGLGMSASGVERFNRSMDSMRQTVGMSVEQFKTDFPAALKTAMFYTGRMEEELRGLITAAKTTGVAVSQLQGVVAQYDTFAGAGEAVGRLNAILGGPYLNAIQMVYSTESERLNLLRQSISASGRQFSTLERYEKKAIMAAAGIQDINTALQLFGQGASAYNEHIQKQQQLEQLARQATPVFEQMRELGMRLAISFRPFLVVMEKLVRVMEALAPKTEIAAGVMSASLAAAFSGMAFQAQAAAANIVSSSQAIVAALGRESMAATATAGALQQRASAAALGMRAAGRLGVAGLAGYGAYQAGKGGSYAGAIGAGAVAGGMAFGAPGAAAGAAIGGIGTYLGGMASGRTGGRAGTAMVGERGPEMVSLPQGSNVVSNENIGRMMASSARSAQQMSQMTSALKSSLDNLSSKLNTVITLDERKADRDRGNVIVLEMDRRVVGQTVVDYINEDSELSLTS